MVRTTRQATIRAPYPNKRDQREVAMEASTACVRLWVNPPSLGAFSGPTVRASPELASIIFGFYSCLFSYAQRPSFSHLRVSKRSLWVGLLLKAPALFCILYPEAALHKKSRLHKTPTPAQKASTD